MGSQEDGKFLWRQAEVYVENVESVATVGKIFAWSPILKKTMIKGQGGCMPAGQSLAARILKHLIAEPAGQLDNNHALLPISALRKEHYSLFAACSDNDVGKLASECEHLVNLFNV